MKGQGAIFIVTRPEPGNAQTCDALARAGLSAVSAPLFEVDGLDYLVPERLPDALLISSANAVRYLKPHDLDRLAGIPVFAVGEATAAAARTSGFQKVVAGTADLTAMSQILRQSLPKGSSLLRLTAPERNDQALTELSDHCQITTILTYQARATTVLPSSLARLAQAERPRAVLHFSRRAAEHFVDLCKANGFIGAIANWQHICLSEAVRLHAFQHAIVADHPTEDAMLKAAVGHQDALGKVC
jgi:uroporphyrinogen-III synthase